MPIPEIFMDDYAYELPKERIASAPLPVRDQSKLLLYRKGEISAHKFYEIAQLLPLQSMLVFNNSKVFPARILFEKETGAHIEVFCLYPLSEIKIEQHACRMLWSCFVGNQKRWNEGLVLSKETSAYFLRARRIGTHEDTVLIEFEWNTDYDFYELLDFVGQIPLPPYLNREPNAEDKERYQTVYAEKLGSVAAPTAGMHFTDSVFEALSLAGVETLFTTLHVGAGTFKPVSENNIKNHQMHPELLEISVDMVEMLLKNPNIIAVGTTSFRLLESLYWMGVRLHKGLPLIDTNGFLVNQWDPYELESEISSDEALYLVKEYLANNHKNSLSGQTQIIVVPGYTCRVVRGLITNFHLPKSTLILLIAALVGQDWKKIYQYALDNNFRFLSYGDSSLLLP